MLNYSSIKSIIAKQGLTFEVAELLLRPDFETGELFWKPRSKELFKNSSRGSYITWNNRYSGLQAFCSTHSDGRFFGRIFRKPYLAHRVLWLLKFGDLPKHEIDHVDHDCTNNLISNLRAVSHKENLQNQTLHSTNTSGVNGVSFHGPTQKWRAQIVVDGEQKHLGVFTIFDDAVAARKAASLKYNFHSNHGKIL